MAMPTVPKTVFDRSLKVVRAPFDAALSVTGTSDSPAKHLLDQIEGTARSATGVLFHDDELLREGRDVRLTTNQREHATELRVQADRVQNGAAAEAEELTADAERREEDARRKAEEEQRAAEKRKRDRRAKAAKKAEKEKKKAAEKATKAKRKDTKVKAAATLDKVEAKEESLDAKGEALATEREAEQLKAEAAAVKGERKNGNGAGT